MMRSFTVLCAVMAGLSGFFLYTKKHQTTLLDHQIAQIVGDTQHIREQTAMLRAEWALLNQPDRLGSLSARFLPDMHPMAPTQFIQMASLAERLPAPGSRPLAAVDPRAHLDASLASHAPAPADTPAEAPAPMAAAAPPPRAAQPPIQVASAQPPAPPAAEPPHMVTTHRLYVADSTPPARPDRLAERPVMMAQAAILPVAAHATVPRPRAAPVSPDLAHNVDRHAALSVARAARPVLPPAAASDPRLAAARPVHPLPVTVAAWRPATPPTPYEEARGYGRGSSLGFSRSGALPPPVPVSN
ncbi:cell division protein FtsL [Gluconacetobacter takamatsuzukensis]|uniref:ABC transporter permease n=1 Tax=Gluconacetobacter takamatsuzukensis TaxID=1286190 RepID=A0A7W4KDP4_9PROT|nr:ABC transporter permease [Gluconacetobacter takamatsuzukensis]MBB2204989.1 ABC transporter permease [Gluconacetobacter takamatsuzukensis]